ncbi:MAG: hypothetical protein IKY83_04485 [Proteobacteria bacterium]|nr:hypothetical protein [Pseudomonadota bacterium]
MRFRISAVLLFCIYLITQNAFAQDQCPEGYVSFINTKTYESICLPVNGNLQPEASQAAAPEEAPAAAASQNVAAAAVEPAQPEAHNEDGESADGLIWGGNADKLEDAGEGAEANMSPEKIYNESQIIHEGVMRPGWSILLGAGYGMEAAIDLKFMPGYHFQSGDDVASFGLYLDFDFRPGIRPMFSMDVTLSPVLHVARGCFRFSLAIGLGAFVYVNNYKEVDYTHEFSEEFGAAFELKPGLAFDWFLTANGFFGFGFSVPLLIHNGGVIPWFNIDMHLGYRF